MKDKLVSDFERVLPKIVYDYTTDISRRSSKGIAVGFTSGSPGFCGIPVAEAETQSNWEIEPNLGRRIEGLRRTVYLVGTSEEGVGMAGRLMYLVDTNIWLELMLEQAKSEEVARFLGLIPSNKLHISDFSFHSICVILTRLKRTSLLLDFVQDVFVNRAVTLVSIKPQDTQELVDAMAKYNLDFDDAYQFVAAAEYGLTLVSFDSDLDATAMGRRRPAEVLADLKPADPD